MADPDYEFMDGFDKYGPIQDDQSSWSILDNGEWTSGASGTWQIMTALGAGADGGALAWNDTSSTGRLAKTLPTNYARCVGGTHYSSASSPSINNGVFQLRDGASYQLSIAHNPSTGRIEIRRGDYDGTVLATSSRTIAVNEVVCIEWDLTVHNSTGVAKVWINGSLTDGCSFTGDTAATANNYYNVLGIHSYSTGRWDHFYTWHYLVAGGTETPCLTNPFIETDFPSSDHSANFSTVLVGVGDDREVTFQNPAISTNQIHVIPVVPEVSGNLINVTALVSTTAGSAKIRAVLYASDGVKATTLLGSSAEQIGITADVPKTFTLSAPVALTAGTTYYIGIMTDTNLNAYGPGGGVGRRWTRTYTSGPDNPANTTQSLTSGIVCWGELSGPTARYAAVNDYPRSFQYNSSSTVGQKDLFGFPALSVTPPVIYSVAVKGYMQRTEAGARTVDLLSNVGGTDYNGSAPGQTPAASLAWNSSYFRKNPATAVAWTKATLDAAKHGYTIVT